MAAVDGPWEEGMSRLGRENMMHGRQGGYKEGCMA